MDQHAHISHQTPGPTYSPPPMSVDQQAMQAMQARCAATCRWLRCTGKGSTVKWAHPCKLAPAAAPPQCNAFGCTDLAVDRFLPGWRCDNHRPGHGQ